MPQSFLNPLPVRPTPENVLATAAFPVPLQPSQRAWWHTVSHLRFGDFNQLPTAGHAASVAEREAQFLKDMTKLFKGTQADWDEESRLYTIADHCELENPRVGRQERATLLPRLAD
jgi:hypothetical protein